MSANDGFLKAVIQAFSETVRIKMEQLYRVVPKNTNSDLTGAFVEEMVRGFIRDWVSPCQLLQGTLHPHHSNSQLSEEKSRPKQIDGLVFDPRRGPAIIREGNFLVAHPLFCRGVIEIKTSCNNLTGFEERLQSLYCQYFEPFYPSFFSGVVENEIMGVVIQDSNPEKTSNPAHLQHPLYKYDGGSHCPIFILFKVSDGIYEPYVPAIEAMIRAVFLSNWQGDNRHERADIYRP